MYISVHDFFGPKKEDAYVRGRTHNRNPINQESLRPSVVLIKNPFGQMLLVRLLTEYISCEPYQYLYMLHETIDLAL